MQGYKKITNISTLAGIEYESYLSFKATLPDTLKASELLQIRWIMTHASYFVSNSTIFISAKTERMEKFISQAICFVNKNAIISGAGNTNFDMAIIFGDMSNSKLDNIFDQVKPNGFMVLTSDIEFTSYALELEVAGLKVYRKPVQLKDIDFNIHVFIPVHNGIKQTLRCLYSIYEQSLSKALNITIIDDGSTDGSTEKIEEQFPDVAVIAGDGTLWWTGAIAKALKARKNTFKNGDYFLLINNDVVLSPNTVLSLISDAVKDRSLCLAPLGFTQDESIACGEAEDGHIFYRFERSSIAMMQDENRFPVLSLFGRCSLYPVEILEFIDNFDAAEFPHYWGDTDFCMRAAKFGYKFKISGKTSIMVQHDVDTTGAHHAFFFKKRTLREVYSYLTDIKSLGNLKYMGRYYSRHYPRQKYRVLLRTIMKALKQTGYKA